MLSEEHFHHFLILIQIFSLCVLLIFIIISTQLSFQQLINGEETVYIFQMNSECAFFGYWVTGLQHGSVFSLEWRWRLWNICHTYFYQTGNCYREMGDIAEAGNDWRLSRLKWLRHRLIVKIWTTALLRSPLIGRQTDGGISKPETYCADVCTLTQILILYWEKQRLITMGCNILG